MWKEHNVYLLIDRLNERIDELNKEVNILRLLVTKTIENPKEYIFIREPSPFPKEWIVTNMSNSDA